jgi:hypothetical protein
MPFRDYAGFNDATLKAMTAGYDAAIAKLGIKSSDPLTSNIAARIAALAAEGERDPVKLCERAIADIAKAKMDGRCR